MDDNYVDLDETAERQQTDEQYQGRDAPLCMACNEPMEWIECWNCGGEGYYSGWEYDPLLYSMDDDIPCPTCNHRGGWYSCVNSHCIEKQKEREL